jgi:hypothetical protein
VFTNINLAGIYEKTLSTWGLREEFANRMVLSMAGHKPYHVCQELLSTMLKKNVKFEWNQEHQTYFTMIKNAFAQIKSLNHVRSDLPFVVRTDASILAVAGTLSQVEGTEELPIAFESKKLSDAERNYPIHELELYAIVYCLLKWRCYLEGKHFIVYSDNKSLLHLQTQQTMSRRMFRWYQTIAGFDFEVKHIKGSENIAADALSRNSVEGEVMMIGNIGQVPSKTVEISAVEEANKAVETSAVEEANPELDWPLYVHEYINTKKMGEDWSKEIKVKIEREKEKFFVTPEDVLYRKVNADLSVPYMPFTYRADYVDKIHSAYGHLGIAGTKDIIAQRAWWPEMTTLITDMIRSCKQCQSVKGSKEIVQKLNPLPCVPPFHRWHIDFIGRLPMTDKGNQWLIVAVDSCTKWPVARALPNATADLVAEFIYDEIFMKFGSPVELVSDRGSNFMDRVLQGYLRKCRVKHNFTSAFHPRANGAVERLNGVLKAMLTKYVGGNVRIWDRFVEQSLFACRLRAHARTGYSPFYLVYGTNPRIPGDIGKPLLFDLGNPDDVVEYRLRTLEDMKMTRQHAKERQEWMKKKMKEAFDAKVDKEDPLIVGDVVKIYNNSREALEPKWLGPLIVRNVMPFGLYQLVDAKGRVNQDLVHRDRLRRATNRDVSDKEFWTTQPTQLRSNQKSKGENVMT